MLGQADVAWSLGKLAVILIQYYQLYWSSDIPPPRLDLITVDSLCHDTFRDVFASTIKSLTKAIELHKTVSEKSSKKF